jgi:hypothetical protein
MPARKVERRERQFCSAPRFKRDDSPEWHPAFLQPANAPDIACAQLRIQLVVFFALKPIAAAIRPYS